VEEIESETEREPRQASSQRLLLKITKQTKFSTQNFVARRGSPNRMPAPAKQHTTGLHTERDCVRVHLWSSRPMQTKASY